MEILEIQGRAFLTGFLKQGLWQASSNIYGDTPDYGLTLRYLSLNLAFIGPRGRYLRVREPRCAEGPDGPGVPGGHGNARRGWGWALAIPIWGGWEGGWVVPGIATLPVLPSRTTPGYYPAAAPHLYVGRSGAGVSANSCFGSSVGDPRGR